MDAKVNIEATKEEQIIIRSLKSRAADMICEGKTDINMARAEFQVAFMFEELHLMAPAMGKPITAYFYGLKVKHAGKSN